MVEQKCFLGMLLDRRHTWLPYIPDLKIACPKLLSLLRELPNFPGELPLVTSHISLTDYKLDYGCQLYSSTTLLAFRILDSVHRAGSS